MPGGIFCIENWSGNLASKGTVAPLLQFLEASGAARVIHQRVETPRELGHYLSRFAELSSYAVGYLALHGDRGRVYVGSTPIKLATLAAWSRIDGPAPSLDPKTGAPTDWVLDLTGKVLYLGSCASLSVSPARLCQLREESGAIAICGYTRSVDWFDAGAFDVLLLSALAGATDSTPNTVRKALTRLGRRSGDLLETLGFVADPDWRARPTSRP